MTITFVLFAYAAVLAVAAPALLRGRWIDRSPRLALALWHAGAVSVLSAAALATIACFANGVMLRNWLAALTGRSGGIGVLAAAAALAVPGYLIGRLGLAARCVAVRRRSERRRHLELVCLLGRHDPELDATVIPVDVPSAYCVPGARRIVLTEGALAILGDAELRAVLAHERAHLAGRHHLLLAWADVLRQAFPTVPLFGTIRPITAHLVELLADDQTVRRVSGERLATAIAALGCGRTPAAGLAASGGSVLARVDRLLAPPSPLPLAARLGGTGAAISMLALPLMVPALLTAGMVACPYLFA